MSMLHLFSNNKMVDVIPHFLRGLRSTVFQKFGGFLDPDLDPDLKIWLQFLDPDLELYYMF